jgi:hypothetical protein
MEGESKIPMRDGELEASECLRELSELVPRVPYDTSELEAASCLRDMSELIEFCTPSEAYQEREEREKHIEEQDIDMIPTPISFVLPPPPLPTTPFLQFFEAPSLGRKAEK